MALPLIRTRINKSRSTKKFTKFSQNFSQQSMCQADRDKKKKKRKKRKRCKRSAFSNKQ